MATNFLFESIAATTVCVRKSYYRELSTLPNVFLVDGLNSQFKYIQNADLIVTENGSPGWEGLIFGRRVLTLSKTFYDGASRARKLDGRESLASTILEILDADPVTDQDSHDRDLSCMIQAEYDTSFDESDMAAGLSQLRQIIRPLMGARKPRKCWTNRFSDLKNWRLFFDRDGAAAIRFAQGSANDPRRPP